MHLNILGTRGIPAGHGGFETFAEKLALYLVSKGHSVTVYCQDDNGSGDIWTDEWNGIERIFYSPKASGPLSTILFDFVATKNVLKKGGVDLVLGYNTAIFILMQRISNRKVFINMDGIEWRRDKWSLPAKAWFFVNELIGANFGSVIIADHPSIALHTKKRSFKKPIVIPYGADLIESSSSEILIKLGLEKNKYFVTIARIEPENSILELVRAFSGLKSDFKLVVLGKFETENSYHAQVRASAGENVLFPGPIYDASSVASLRLNSAAYLHGHTVGGTNPSLVEAMGAGCVVLAHDNEFNKWVTGSAQLYFRNELEAAEQLSLMISDDFDSAKLRARSKERFLESFTWTTVLEQYEKTLLSTDLS